MRLTLRTLLAYLDDTLEKSDAEDLKAKIDESGFATQLVARIRAALESEHLTAWSPDAAGPVQDANLISEYLDSTLTPEQVAEIERACLESDTGLAEAAACHQILTRALGKPAEVPPALRTRIHQLPSQVPPKAGAAEPIAGAPAVEPADAEPPAVSEVPGSHSDLTVPPLGSDDSGVSDAPTRIRDAAALGESADTGVPISGSRGRHVASDFYGGSIRPSRITPWLVSLALAAALLFALVQIFEPLLEDRTAESDVPQTLSGDAAPAADEIRPERSEREADRADAGQNAPLRSAPAPASPRAAEAETEEAGSEANTGAEAGAARDLEPERDADEPTADALQPPPEPRPEGEQADGEPPAAESPEPASADEAAAPSMPVPEAPAAEATQTPPEADAGDAPPPAPEPALATLRSDDALVLARQDEAPWRQLAGGDAIDPGATLVAAPLYRPTLVTAAGVDTTLVGPAEVRLSRSGSGEPVVALNHGRLLMESSDADAQIDLVLAGQPLRVTFAEPETVVAIEAKPVRAPGTDPFDEANHSFATAVSAARGTVELTSPADRSPAWEDAGGASTARSADAEGSLTLDEEQQWLWRSPSESSVTTLESLPAWIEANPQDGSAIEAGAREGLLALIDAQQPLEMSLREAIQFRRVEVGALAGRTLLFLGRGDVYFGSDGILNQPRQRNYWPEHYASLLTRVDLSVEAAQALRDKIASMEATDGEALFRLLVGFSQGQLEAGADAQLVQWLDSPSMAVRVLALENLRQITGTTLYFKPQEENPIRRSDDINKWEVRLRKGDIRWPEEQPAGGEQATGEQATGGESAAAAGEAPRGADDDRVAPNDQ